MQDSQKDSLRASQASPSSPSVIASLMELSAPVAYPSKPRASLPPSNSSFDGGLSSLLEAAGGMEDDEALARDGDDSNAGSGGVGATSALSRDARSNRSARAAAASRDYKTLATLGAGSPQHASRGGAGPRAAPTSNPPGSMRGFAAGNSSNSGGGSSGYPPPTLGQMAAQVQAKAAAGGGSGGRNAFLEDFEAEEGGSGATAGADGGSGGGGSGRRTGSGRSGRTSSGGEKACAPGSEATGRWTKSEHEMFLKALRKFGKEWKKVAAMVKTRTVVQTRTHAQKYFQKLQKREQTGEVIDQPSERCLKERGGTYFISSLFRLGYILPMLRP